jgi:hypothetical protein
VKQEHKVSKVFKVKPEHKVFKVKPEPKVFKVNLEEMVNKVFKEFKVNLEEMVHKVFKVKQEQQEQGIQGETGAQGIQGETGAQGIQGETGATSEVSISSESEALRVGNDGKGNFTLGPRGVTTEVVVTSGKSLITLFFVDGIFVGAR